jgi:nucleoside-diphosphate-sugar epimerase
MRVLVTGANGFLGSALVRRLLRDGHEVRAFARSRQRAENVADLPLEVVYGDVVDPESLRSAMGDIEVVHHVAGLASDWAPLSAFESVNVTGVENVLTAARATGVRRVVHISSAAVHGFAGYRDRRESDPTPPTPFPYVETKRRGEEIALAAHADGGPEVVVMRPGNVYGPRDGVTSIHLLRAMRSGTMGVIDGGRYLTCPAYVENVVDAVALAATVPDAAGRAYLVTDGLEITWSEWLAEMARAMGIAPPRLSVPKRLAEGLAAVCEGVWRTFRIRRAPPLTRYRVANGGHHYHFSIERARDELGWEPHVDVAEACRRTVAWFEEATR